MHVQRIHRNEVISGLFTWVNKVGQDIDAHVYVSDKKYPHLEKLNHTLSRPYTLFKSEEGTRVIKEVLGPGTQVSIVQIGGEPFIRSDKTQQPLKGNYGVLYQVELELNNSSSYYQKAEVWFIPIAGQARGTFLLEDKVIEVASRSGIPKSIMSWKLPPFTKKKIKIQTMPEPGAFYPVELMIKTEEKKGLG